jgi:hypothetical protein
MSWNAGDGVALKYSGASPDIGAFEFGSTDADDQAPTPPNDPSATAASATQIALSWNASTDNVGVAAYNVYRCTGDCTPTAIIGTTNQTTYTDTDLTPSTQYSYQLSAVDPSGNASEKTNTFTAATRDTDSGDGNGGAGSSGCFIKTSSQTSGALPGAPRK